MGSKAPKTVVPAVALTKNGMWPLALLSQISLSSSETIIRPLQENYLIFFCHCLFWSSGQQVPHTFRRTALQRSDPFPIRRRKHNFWWSNGTGPMWTSPTAQEWPTDLSPCIRETSCVWRLGTRTGSKWNHLKKKVHFHFVLWSRNYHNGKLTVLPGAKMESPLSQSGPIISRIFLMTTVSIRIKTGAIS